MSFGPPLKANGSRQPLRIDEMRRALAVLMDPDHSHEIRGLPSGRAKVVYGGDISGLCDAATELSDNDGIYYTLNPVPLYVSHAKAANVIKRRWLLIDVDSEKGPIVQSSTEEEKQTAWEVRSRIEVFLERSGWPAPVVVDSGNGWHMLYRIDLPNTNESAALVKNVLETLASQFDGNGPVVDTKVYDAPRIAKLPGTWARKGKDAEDRPHRLCKLVSVPAVVLAVSKDQLEEVCLKSEIGLKVTATNGPPTDVVQRAKAYLRKCPPAISGQGGHIEAFKTAIKGVRGFNLTVEQGIEALEEWNQRCQPPWSDKELRHKVEDSLKNGERGFHLKDDPRPSGQQWASSTGIEWCFTLDGEIIAAGTPDELAAKRHEVDCASGPMMFPIYSFPGLMHTVFPNPNYVVEGLLSEGLNILAGSPKTGKSMLALNLAITISGGGLALKNMPVKTGDVLYLALEDSARRVQSRARMMLKGLGCEVSGRFRVATRWPSQEEGGLTMLDLWAKSVERPTLVIIDVWGKFRPEIKSGGSQYGQDYKHLSAVKDFLDRRGCNSLVLMHTRKAQSDEEIHAISGTQGLAGVADGILILKRTRNDTEAKLTMTGRDFQSKDMVIEFDPETVTWKSLGTAEEHMQGKLQKAIVDYLKMLNGMSTFASDIADHLDVDQGTVRKALHRLFDRRIVRREGKAWAYPGDGEAME